jgi:ankyrin repeat protein
MVQAAIRGDADELRLRLSRGEDVNQWEFDAHLGETMTPLIAAASSEEAGVEVIRSLLQSGADVRAKSKGWNTSALWWASSPQKANLLIKAGGDLLEKAKNGRSVISNAAEQNDLETVRKALEEGAPLDAPHEYSFARPIFAAVEAGALEVVEYLLDRGLDVNLQDRDGTPLVHFATDPKMIRFLASRGADLERRNQFGWTALGNAVGSSSETVKALLESGANLTSTHDGGYTILMQAAGCMERQPEIVQLLIERGADPAAVSIHGYNALHAFGDTDGQAGRDAEADGIAQVLARAGCPLEAINNRGYTPLLRAVYEGYPREAIALLKVGADPNARVKGNGPYADRTSLMWAAHSFDLVQALLEAGADPNARDRDGYSALDHALALLEEEKSPSAGACQISSSEDALDGLPEDIRTFMEEMERFQAENPMAAEWQAKYEEEQRLNEEVWEADRQRSLHSTIELLRRLTRN